MKITYPPIILLASLITQFIIFFSFPIRADLTSLLGLILIFVGLSMAAISFRLMSKIKTTFIPDGVPEKLVSTGPFKFSRNPIYLGMFLVLFGTAFLMGSVSALLVSLIFVLIINFTWISHEEKKMSEIFGEDWIDYCSKVRRWL
ncbi:MAG: methyltransferase family protein [Gammaproteobacteria bacterium]|tara:strand:+ start:107 stop:541 length:435 start_codon:yes stop_codon:yes gene_type:complete